MSIDPNAIVTIRLGTLCTDIMAAIVFGATPPHENIVPDVAASNAAKIVHEMIKKGHLKVNP